jgi:hypothetical protein
MSSHSSRSDQSNLCVVCGKPQVKALRPFCSRRCADVDLYHWLSGAYALPAPEDDAGAGPAEPARRSGRDG